MVRIGRIVGSVMAVVALFVAVQPAAAQAPATFTLKPGSKAVVTFEAFCTEFGKLFPTGVQLPDGVVADPARAALSYGVSKGYPADATKALNLQYAIWLALGTANSPKGDATTQDVVANGKAVPANPQGTSLIDAAKANQVKLTLNSFQPIGPKVQVTTTASDNFYGQGQVTVENTTQQTLTLYMPVGTRFPAVDPKHQTLAGYATNVQVTDPAPQPSTLPATSGGEMNTMLPLLALALLVLGGAVGIVRRRA